MKNLRFSSQYKRDVKRFRNNPEKMAKVANILKMLRDEIHIPKEYNPHMLKGQ